jgi:hypothetical protein
LIFETTHQWLCASASLLTVCEMCVLSEGLYVWQYVCVSVFVSVCLSICLCPSICLCLCVCPYVCVCVSICLCLCLSSTHIIKRHGFAVLQRDLSLVRVQQPRRVDQLVRLCAIAQPGSSGGISAAHLLLAAPLLQPGVAGVRGGGGEDEHVQGGLAGVSGAIAATGQGDCREVCATG